MIDLTHIIGIERDNHRFYADAAERVNDDRARRFLTALATEEKNHEHTLMRLLSEEIQGIDVAALATVRNLFREFLHNQEHTIGQDTSLPDILIKAIELEIENAGYYRRLESETKDQAMKQKYLELGNWEDSHRRILEILLEHIESPDCLLRAAELIFKDKSS